MEKVKLTRRELYDMVWKEPMSTISKKFNITDTGLRKACKRMNIPTPIAGYWAKLQFGKPVFQENLPVDYGGIEIVELEQIDDKAAESRESERARLINEMKADTTLDLAIPPTLNDACLLIKEVNDYYQQKLRDETVRSNELLVHYMKQYLDVSVTPKELDRMLRFADALIKNLKRRGHEVKIVNGKTILCLFGEEFQINFRECTKRDQIIDNHGSYSWKRTVYIPTGILKFTVHGYYGREWRDRGLLLEEQLAKILAQLELLGMRAKKERDTFRARQVEYEVKKKEEDEKREQKLHEVRRFKSLLSEAKHFDEAQMIRRYIEAVKEKVKKDSMLTGKDREWIHWAEAKADWFDPLVFKFDPILGTFSIRHLEGSSKGLFC